ncbi:MAG: hypothetical protein ACJ8DC_16470 [Gemmatimonadales bacterium]
MAPTPFLPRSSHARWGNLRLERQMGERSGRLLRRQAGLRVLAAVALLAGVSCGGDIAVPSRTIVITTTTSGPDADPDGYALSVDGGADQAIGLNATATLDVAAGDHSVQLSGVMENCAVQGANPQAVTVDAGGSAAVGFGITCADTDGTLEVTASTTGPTPDADGYTLTVDSAIARPLEINASLTVPALPPGSHRLALAGVAANCTVEEPNPRTVTTAAGATTSVAFAVSCLKTALQWQPLASGTTFHLSSVWGSSASDVFALGEPGGTWDSGIFHYDGHAWSPQASEHDVTLHALWGSGANDVFAAGFRVDGVRPQGVLLHYDGNAWSTMAGPAIGETDVEVYFESLWGTSGSDVFAVGNFYHSYENGLIAHYDGTSWSKMSIPYEAGRELVDVFGTSSSDVYAVGSINFPDAPRFGIILHYDGSQWTELLIQQEGLGLRSVWSNSATDVFAVGDVFDEPSQTFSGTILHYDGRGWSPLSTPASGRLFGIWGASGTDVFAVGDNVGENGTILHYDGERWTREAAKVDPANVGLFGIWGASSTDVFAVGGGATILHGTR